MVKKSRKNHAKLHSKGRLLWIIISILVLLQIIELGYIVKFQNDATVNTEQRVSYLVNSAEERRYTYPVIDVSAKRVYIPEAHIYLPLNDTSRFMRYDFFEMKGSERIYLSMPSAIGRQLPHADPSCDKVVALTQHKTQMDSAYHLVGTTKSATSDYPYIYAHDSCNIYPPRMVQELVDTARLLRGY